MVVVRSESKWGGWGSSDDLAANRVKRRLVEGKTGKEAGEEGGRRGEARVTPLPLHTAAGHKPPPSPAPPRPAFSCGPEQLSWLRVLGPRVGYSWASPSQP